MSAWDPEPDPRILSLRLRAKPNSEAPTRSEWVIEATVRAHGTVSATGATVEEALRKLAALLSKMPRSA